MKHKSPVHEHGIGNKQRKQENKGDDALLEALQRPFFVVVFIRTLIGCQARDESNEDY